MQEKYKYPIHKEKTSYYDTNQCYATCLDCFLKHTSVHSVFTVNIPADLKAVFLSNSNSTSSIWWRFLFLLPICIWLINCTSILKLSGKSLHCIYWSLGVFPQIFFVHYEFCHISLTTSVVEIWETKNVNLLQCSYTCMMYFDMYVNHCAACRASQISDTSDNNVKSNQNFSFAF